MENETYFDVNAFASLGQSNSIFAVSLMDNIDIYPNIKVVTSDMALAAGLDRFRYLYPDCFYNVGIAEQNLIGVAAGLASEGFKSIAVAQAAFISMRSFEMVRQYLGYMHNNVILVGLNAGFLLKFFGNTHYATEDLSLMRGIPGMIVLSPADAGEAVKAFEAALRTDASVYIRLTGLKEAPIVYKEDFSYEIGKSNVIHEGDDITIFATGSMVHQVVIVGDLLETQGIKARIVDVHTIKPMDVDIVNESKHSKLFVSVEEHNLIGGLGSSISEYISEFTDYPPLLRLGVKDTFSIPGDYDYLLKQNRLMPDLIAEDILNKYKQ
ncbi:MAG: transketolase C-terminal domain-containing protein [Bacteroidales bacterium]|nr:transketolase C-terminal domain-containing protein [Bacteroidales bacterium]MDD4711988.1 transketolase C-terminal domain-containing protein [Bacteroidales bacterium]